jgi:hypothetical protein
MFWYILFVLPSLNLLGSIPAVRACVVIPAPGTEPRRRDYGKLERDTSDGPYRP